MRVLKMPAGKFRNRVRFERRADDATGDGAGNFKADWAVIPGLDNWPCDIEDMGGGEAVQAGDVSGTGKVSIELHACAEIAGVKVTDRIVDTVGAQVYNINYVARAGDRDQLAKFVCEYGVADG